MGVVVKVAEVVVANIIQTQKLECPNCDGMLFEVGQEGRCVGCQQKWSVESRRRAMREVGPCVRDS